MVPMARSRSKFVTAADVENRPTIKNFWKKYIIMSALRSWGMFRSKTKAYGRYQWRKHTEKGTLGSQNPIFVFLTKNLSTYKGTLISFTNEINTQMLENRDRFKPNQLNTHEALALVLKKNFFGVFHKKRNMIISTVLLVFQSSNIYINFRVCWFVY